MFLKTIIIDKGIINAINNLIRLFCLVLFCFVLFCFVNDLKQIQIDIAFFVRHAGNKQISDLTIIHTFLFLIGIKITLLLYYSMILLSMPL